jgi:WD40 repeat protein
MTQLHAASQKRTEKALLLAGHDASIVSLSFSSDGKYLASASNDNSVLVWDAQSFDLIRVHYLPEDWVLAKCLFSPDGKYLALSGSLLFLWDTDTWKLLRTSYNSPSDYAFSPDGESMCYDVPGDADYSHVLRIVRTRTGGFRRSISLPELTNCESITFSNDGVLVAVLQYDTPRNASVATYDIAHRKLRSIEMPACRRLVEWTTEAATRIAAISADGATLYDAESGLDDIRGIAISPNGTSVVPVTTYSSEVFTRHMPPSGKVRVLKGHKNNTRAITFSHNGRWIASGDESGTIIIWSTLGKRKLLTFRLLPDDLWICCSPDGRYIGSEGAERYLRARRGTEVLHDANGVLQPRCPSLIEDTLSTKYCGSR